MPITTPSAPQPNIHAISSGERSPVDAFVWREGRLEHWIDALQLRELVLNYLARHRGFPLPEVSNRDSARRCYCHYRQPIRSISHRQSSLPCRVNAAVSPHLLSFKDSPLANPRAVQRSLAGRLVPRSRSKTTSYSCCVCSIVM